MKTLVPVALLLLALGPITAQTWYPANEPYGGRVASLHEASDGALLCGTLKGLYRSTDDGMSWQNISGSYGNWSFASITSTPSGNYLVLKSLYEVLRSSDGGQNWTPLVTPNWTSASKLIANSSGQVFISTNTNAWRSDDEGDTWTAIPTPAPQHNLRSLRLSPDEELFASTTNQRILRSDDNGDTWTELFTAANDIQEFAFVGNDVVYALTSFSGFYNSTDNGDTWTLLPALPGTNGGYALAANAGGDVFVGSYDDLVFRSTDGGNTWTDVSYDLPNPATVVLMVNSNDELVAGTKAAGVQVLNGTSWDARNEGITGVRFNRMRSFDGVLYACTDYGVFASVDQGVSWQQSVLGMVDTEVLAIAKATNGDLYAGSEQLYRSQDGLTWTDISSGFPGGEAFVTDLLAEPGGRLIAATDEWGIRFSDDEGATWTNANTGLDDVTMNFIRKASNGYYFTADGYNLYRSNDLTGTWEVINTGLTDTDIEEFAAGNGKLFAITYSDGLFTSADNGDTWDLSIDEDFENVTVNGNEVYCASPNGTTGGVYRSLDNGGTWTNIVNGLPIAEADEVHYMSNVGVFARVEDELYTLDFNVVGIPEATKDRLDLSAFPNPFSEVTFLRVVLSEPAQVALRIMNVHGQVVQEHALGSLGAGRYDVPVAEELTPGVYVVTVFVGEQNRSMRLVKAE
ncbi:MAG: T9SS type A sorting domain-containing protein [Flavobacteriales bacterium]|nr:T9SS type A sorting domain-containing protein [Flavobacteriales bacterium]